MGGLQAQRERERWASRRSAGTAPKTIDMLIEREKRAQRKTWRKKQQESRGRRRVRENLLTPPTSPDHPPDQAQRAPAAGRRRRGRPRSQVNRLKEMENDIENVKRKLKGRERKLNKCRVQLHRLIKKNESPVKKMDKLLKRCKVDSDVRKEITRQKALLDDTLRKIKERRNTIKRSATGNISEFIISARIVRKYRMKNWLRGKGIDNKFLRTGTVNKRGRLSISPNIQQKIEKFYIRDDVSTMTSGKKSTITKHKIEKQKRFLQNTILELHARYNQQCDPKESVSYTTFWRSKPFWVVQPKINDRATCECTKCLNLEIMLQKLKRENVISYKNTREIMQDCFCSITTLDCIEGNCSSCKNNEMTFCEDNLEKVVEWQQWGQKQIDIVERHDGVGKSYLAKVTVPALMKGSIHELVETFCTEMENKGFRYLFVRDHQQKSLNEPKSKLDDRSCIILIDFAENYGCKFSKEAQGMQLVPRVIKQRSMTVLCTSKLMAISSVNVLPLFLTVPVMIQTLFGHF